MMTFMPEISLRVATSRVVFTVHRTSTGTGDEDGRGRSGELSFELVRRHFADVLDRGWPELLPHHLEIFRAFEVDLKGAVTEADDLRRREMLGGQGEHVY